MATRGTQYGIKMSCVVQFSFDVANSSCRNCSATANSASFSSVPLRSSSGLTLSVFRKSSLPGFKVHRDCTSLLFLTLNLALISHSTASRVLKYRLLHPVLSLLFPFLTVTNCSVHHIVTRVAQISVGVPQEVLSVLRELSLKCVKLSITSQLIKPLAAKELLYSTVQTSWICFKKYLDRLCCSEIPCYLWATNRWQ
ncbi:unnamed protein product [Lepeophtheirus salmonis]|uniref:(salmon louse) hypothetical protein n=1 Tax=Lepeophtheirus salmonis TaxID=72036 RepID=A0A7R8CUU7_LEPSM|nr:unnamed protein product [Lepeophtheirus salmonis]CAF2939535.1 unnamed protein product [Lepeophtheirus salmonis]